MDNISSMTSRLYSFLSESDFYGEISLRTGTLTELSGAAGSGKTELLLKFLARHPELRIAWIESPFTLYPCAVIQTGVTLDRILFAEARDTTEALWIAHQALRSQLFGVLVLATQIETEIELRRLQLDAEKAQTLVFLLTLNAKQEGTWPITVQLLSYRIPGQDDPQVRVLKHRGLRLWKSELPASSC